MIILFKFKKKNLKVVCTYILANYCNDLCLQNIQLVKRSVHYKIYGKKKNSSVKNGSKKVRVPPYLF
jgi:hypothetical protein